MDVQLNRVLCSYLGYAHHLNIYDSKSASYHCAQYYAQVVATNSTKNHSILSHDMHVVYIWQWPRPQALPAESLGTRLWPLLTQLTLTAPWKSLSAPADRTEETGASQIGERSLIHWRITLNYPTDCKYYVVELVNICSLIIMLGHLKYAQTYNSPNSLINARIKQNYTPLSITQFP